MPRWLPAVLAALIGAVWVAYLLTLDGFPLIPRPIARSRRSPDAARRPTSFAAPPDAPPVRARARTALAATSVLCIATAAIGLAAVLLLTSDEQPWQVRRTLTACEPPLCATSTTASPRTAPAPVIAPTLPPPGASAPAAAPDGSLVIAASTPLADAGVVPAALLPPPGDALSAPPAPGALPLPSAPADAAPTCAASGAGGPDAQGPVRAAKCRPEDGAPPPERQ